MIGFDRSLARGPWRALPVPAFLADRGAALRFQLGWAAALAAVLALLVVWAPGGLTAPVVLRLAWSQCPSTLLLAVGLGIVAVALAPVLLSRRLTRLNLPAKLRVVE